MESKKYYPSIKQAIVLLVIAFLIQALAGFIGGIVIKGMELKNYSKPTLDFSEFILCISFISEIIIIFIGLKKAKTPLKKIFESPKTNIKDILFLMVLVVGTWFVMAGLAIIYINNSQAARETQERLSSILLGSSKEWFSILSVVIIAPILEEIVFRGIILQGFLKNYSITKAIIITAVLFGLFHGNIVQTPLVILLGIVLGVIYIKTGSLFMCIVGHVLNNFLALFAGNIFLINGRHIYTLIAGIVLTIVSGFVIKNLPNNIQCLEEVEICKENIEA
ncbi:MAG: CPBP family intramembrane metalloprotease [Caloramator sp.]|nr:CPBP family intramembrane metalloprotease [Caloramator sp.]